MKWNDMKEKEWKLKYIQRKINLSGKSEKIKDRIFKK